MKRKHVQFSDAPRSYLIILILVWLLASGCSRQASKAPQVFPMGERVEVGPLVYIVQETEWRDQLGEGMQARTPEHRFLLVRLTVTNSGTREADVPPLSLLASDGRSYNELSRGDGIPEWLGYLRTLQPAATEHGRVAFDAPAGAYRLRVAALGDNDEESYALIDLPYQVTPSIQLPLTTPGAPSP